jgi:predicted nucleic acid-binding protein
LRARYGFRTPDAVHLATAISEGASVFLTGDAELVRCDEVNVELLT